MQRTNKKNATYMGMAFLFLSVTITPLSMKSIGLSPSLTGARVSLRAGALSITDGPFTESKELISYAIYDVRSKEEAVEWTNRFLKLHRDLWPEWEGEADVLKVFGPEDFAPPA